MLRNDNEFNCIYYLAVSSGQQGGVRNVIDAKKKDATVSEALPATAKPPLKLPRILTSRHTTKQAKTMTATSTPMACTDQQPELYRLAHQSRWSSSSDLTGLHDRLAYLARDSFFYVGTSGVDTSANFRCRRECRE